MGPIGSYRALFFLSNRCASIGRVSSAVPSPTWKPISPKPQANYILLLLSFLCQESDHTEQKSHQCSVLVLRGRAAAVDREVHRPLGLVYRRNMWQFPAEMLPKSRMANMSLLDGLSSTTLNLPGSHMFPAPGPRRSGRAILFSQTADSFRPVSVSALSLTLLFSSNSLWCRWEVTLPLTRTYMQQNEMSGQVNLLDLTQRCPP